MPKHELTLQHDTDQQTALAIAYGAMNTLGWNILFADENSLIASAGKGWNNYGQQVTCTVENGHFNIRSEMTNGEMLDLASRNKKTCLKFAAAFESVKTSIDMAGIDANNQSIEELGKASIEKSIRDQEEAVAVEKAMNLSGSNLYLTYAIIGINVLVFILMAVNGAGIFEPNGFVHIRWGSNYTPLTLSGDWWRLVTNIFIHFGIIHLIMNMYCFYTIGIYLEPMLGKARYISGYLCTGILASLVSLWWHKEGVNSAGASGAIFGMYGIFLALLTSNLIPESIRKALLQSIGIFVVYNLVYGMKSGVDNAAHVGGLISGFAIGYLFVYDIKKEKQEQKLHWVLPVIIVISIATAYSYLQQNKVDQSKRTAALNEVKADSYKDNDRFNERLGEFDNVHKEIINSISDTAATYDQLHKSIVEVALPGLQKAQELISKTKEYDLSPESHNKASMLISYIELRKKQIELMKEITETNKTDELLPQLIEMRQKADDAFDALLKL